MQLIADPFLYNLVVLGLHPFVHSKQKYYVMYPKRQRQMDLFRMAEMRKIKAYIHLSVIYEPKQKVVKFNIF